MLQPYGTIEELLVGLEAHVKSIAQHPAINLKPEQIKIATSSRFKRCHARCCKKHNRIMDTWTIVFNLPVLKNNLDNVVELDLLCKHEVAHVISPDHSHRFKHVCRQLGIPESKLVRSAKSSGLKIAKATEVYVCLRCGEKKTTQKEHTNKRKVCSWCGYHTYIPQLGRIDSARTSIMMTVEEAEKYKPEVRPNYERIRAFIAENYELPWGEYAKYIRSGGDLKPSLWWVSTKISGLSLLTSTQGATANKSDKE